MDIKKQLMDEYRYRFELHAHSSPVSGCSEIPCEEFAKIFSEDGFDGVAVTNHLQPDLIEKFSDYAAVAEYYLADYREIKKHAGDNLSVCLGAEIRFTENYNDYLVFGIDENDIEKFISYLDRGIDVFYREMKNEKNVILQAHPFRDGLVIANSSSIDGMEVFNFHSHHNSRIATAAEYVKNTDMLVSGGTDFHHMWQRNQAAMRCKSLPRDSYDVAELIKSGDFIFELGNSIIIP